MRPVKVAIDIGALTKEVVNLVGSEAASREITLRIDDSPALPWVIGDRIQIQQCVLNLLMNALDATAQTKSGPREVTIRIAPEKIGWIRVSVCDTRRQVSTRRSRIEYLNHSLRPRPKEWDWAYS